MFENTTPGQRPNDGSITESLAFEKLPLDMVCLLISEPHTGPIDFTEYIHRLDLLAEESVLLAKGSKDSQRLFDSMHAVLFEKYGFSGNKDDYYNPDNSFLNIVLDTHRGIPISLSIVMLEVARRLELPVFGVGLPCHFVTGFATEEGVRFFDPFNQGVERTRSELVEMVQDLSQGSMQVSSHHFQPITRKMMISRILCNLRGIYRNRKETDHLISVLRHLVLLHPNQSSLHGELATLLVNSGNYGEARNHISQCLSLGKKDQCCGEAPWIMDLKKVLATLN